MDKETKELSLFEEQQLQKLRKDKLCLHCVHRKSIPLNEHSKTKQICCEMQPSKHSNSGYQTIKAHDFACGLYEQRL
jgi:hypothetical protein